MPMGKVLRIQLFKILALFLALSCLTTLKSLGQIPLVDLRSFEISFTPGESSRGRSVIDLSMQEAKRMSGLVDIDDVQPFRYTSENDRQLGFYYTDTPGGVSLGRYYHKDDNRVLAQLPIRNGTPANISGLSIAFDFVYLPVQKKPDISFQLSYRVNDGEWISPAGGFFTSELLQRKEKEWNSFSMQIYLERLYILPNDQLEIKWAANGDESVFIPIALQKIEMFATEAAPRHIYAGSLIISELMTSFDTGSGSLEYIEIYNSTEDPINLKGLVLQSADNRVVVQQEIIAEPYTPVVLAGFDRGNKRFESLSDYRYTEQLLGENSGRLSLTLDGKHIARALFESQKKGTAVQMNHLENAFDGYSSLSHFVPASDDWNSLLTGTPGRIEPGHKLYSKTIDDVGGWYMLEPPGILSESTNRDFVNSLTTLGADESTSGTADLLPPYIYFHSHDADPVRLYSSDKKLSKDSRAKSSVLNRRSFTSIAVKRPLSISEIINSKGQQAYPALLTWNASNQTFETIWRTGDRVDPWNSYLVSGDVIAKQTDRGGRAANKNTWTGLTRMIGLSLVSAIDSESQAVTYDNSMIGFWEPAVSNKNGADFDLPKLWSPMPESAREERSPMIYLTSAAEAKPASYLNFPYTPDNNIRLSVGLKLPVAVDRARFMWDFVDSLPEQWDIEFVDTEIGESINMRHENFYAFSERSDVVREDVNDPDLLFQQVEPDDYSRFYIRISPTGNLGTFESQTENTESIELKQNYPNPFNPTTTVGFYLPVTTDVRIGVYNVVGQQVGLLVDDRLSAGDHTASWNALDMPSGVYIIQLEAMNTVQTRKITLIK